MRFHKVLLLTECVTAALSAFLCAGVRFVFHACAPKEDGSWMTCHWAEQAVFAAAIILVVQSVLLFLIRRNGIKSGIAMAMVPVALSVAVLPGGSIRLCMMESMRCHTVMRPAVTILAVLTAVCAAVTAYISARHCGHGQKSSGG